LSQLLHDEDIKKFEIKGRLKSPYRIFEKLNAKYDTKELDSVLDILAFRIITDSVASCYAIL
jgi:(p)ppGpp synthase/HD superfamily hydrolase